MKIPLLQEDALLADIARVRSPVTMGNPQDQLHVWWLGQSGFLLIWDHHRVLLDPYLSDSLTRKYAATDKPHVRVSERVIAPERLESIQVVTSSHSHTDHLDLDTLQPLVRTNPGICMVCPEAIRETVRARTGLPDSQILGTDPSAPEAPVRVSPFTFHPIPAAHESLERDAHGRLLYLGFVIEVGPFRVYHSGDTVRYPGMEDILRPFAVDLALLPINGRAPERRVAGNLDGREAARLAQAIQARMAVPCHYDMFAFNTASPNGFAQEAAELGQPARILQQGERLTLRAATHARSVTPE